MAVFGTATNSVRVEGCKYFVIPKTRTEWWTEKIRKNKERDQQEHEALRKTGWNIITVWECQLKPRKREQTLEGILLLLQKIYLDLQKKPIITPYTPPATEFPIVAEPPSPYGDD